MTNFGKLQLFDLGRQMKKRYGKKLFMRNNHTIISNFPRCMKSFKFFLLGILSESDEITMTSDDRSNFDRVNNQKNNVILQSIENLLGRIKMKMKEEGGENVSFSLDSFTKFKNEILGQSVLKKKRRIFRREKKKSMRPHLKCTEKDVVRICKEMNISEKSFSLEIPKKKEDFIFHPIKQME